MQAQQLAHPRSEHGVVTVSGGLACSTSVASLTSDAVLRAADEALFAAKAAGRNTFTVVGEGRGIRV